jgi:C-terminal processing protease CtpA/Prc
MYAQDIMLASADGAIVVQYVAAGSNAAAAGLLAGDRILAVDGYVVDSKSDSPARVELRVNGIAGTQATLRVKRKNQELTFTYHRDDIFVLMGIGADTKPGSLGFTLGAIESMQWVVVEITPGSSAEKAGLKMGDILLAIDGNEISGRPLTSLFPLLKRPEGTVLKLKVQPIDASQKMGYLMLTVGKPSAD